jgi:Na+-translocating ferredoxin:NAD+ oxidoreductase RnfD subunit
MLKKKRKERHVWIDITITLLALEIMAYFYYGVRTLVLGGICVAGALVTEFISLRLMHRRFTADDLTCTSDALITALMMPAVINYKIAGIACIFAVIVAKNIFGGRRNMIFSPSAVAYLFILTSWKADLLNYPEPYDKTGIFETAENISASASYVLNNMGTFQSTDFEILLGNFKGPMGAVSILLIILSAVILFFRKDISRGSFIGTILGTGIMAYLCPITDSRIDSVKYVFATNMILFAAVYIIADRRIAPTKNYYAFFYGFFIAISSYVVTLTTGKENVIVIMSVLFTPVSLMLKNLQKMIDRESFRTPVTVPVTGEEENEVEISAEAVALTESFEEVAEATENSDEEFISIEKEIEDIETVGEENPAEIENTETVEEEIPAETENPETVEEEIPAETENPETVGEEIPTETENPETIEEEIPTEEKETVTEGVDDHE